MLAMKWTAEYRAEWRATRRGEANEYAAKYRQANVDAIKDSQLRWYAKNAESQRLKKHSYHRSVSGKLSLLRQSAKTRGLAMLLTQDEYVEITEHNECLYCGFSLPEVGGGLDRVDNAVGYVTSNVVPCCKDCNTARGDAFTHEEMKLLGKHMRAIKLARNKGTDND